MLLGKYVPLTLFALLVLGRVASLTTEVGYFHRVPTPKATYRGHVSLSGGSLGYSIYPYLEKISPSHGLAAKSLPGSWNVARAMGNFHWQRRPWPVLSVPLVWLLTALVPLVVGGFSRYRFRAWMVAVWIALIAGQWFYVVFL